MPYKKKSCIGKHTLQSRKMKVNRCSETPYNRENRLNANRLRSNDFRACENLDIRQIRNEADRLRKSVSRAAESPVNREIRVHTQRMRMQTSRQALGADLKLAALNYDKKCDYRYLI